MQRESRELWYVQLRNGALAGLLKSASLESMSDYSDSTLIIAGHGSTVNAESSLPTYQHCEAIRSLGIFSRVIPCFWKEEPALSGALRGAHTPRVFIVPLFISEGYFTEEVIPREMGFVMRDKAVVDRVEKRGGQTIHYCGPVGTHHSMTELLKNRAMSTLDQFPFPSRPADSSVTLFIAGHGTGNNTNSRKAIEEQVDIIRRENIYHNVHAIFMEEDPMIKECYNLSETRNIVVVPFFISDGLHSFEDIPVMLGEKERIVRERYNSGMPTWRNPTEIHGKRVWYTPSIGNEPGMVDVILERVREAEDMAREPMIAQAP